MFGGGAGSIQGAFDSLKENKRLRRSSLDKYFKMDNVVLFNPEPTGKREEHSPELKARLKVAELKRRRRELAILSIWAIGIAITTAAIIFLCGTP